MDKFGSVVFKIWKSRCKLSGTTWPVQCGTVQCGLYKTPCKWFHSGKIWWTSELVFSWFICLLFLLRWPTWHSMLPNAQIRLILKLGLVRLPLLKCLQIMKLWISIDILTNWGHMYVLQDKKGISGWYSIVWYSMISYNVYTCIF